MYHLPKSIRRAFQPFLLFSYWFNRSKPRTRLTRLAREPVWQSPSHGQSHASSLLNFNKHDYIVHLSKMNSTSEMIYTWLHGWRHSLDNCSVAIHLDSRKLIPNVVGKQCWNCTSVFCIVLNTWGNTWNMITSDHNHNLYHCNYNKIQ